MIFQFPFLFARVPKFDKRFISHIFTGYKEGDKEYVWSVVHSSCSNAPGFEWLSNAPVIWVFTRFVGVPLGFLAGVLMLPFVIVLGGICWVGELRGKERGWLV